MAIKRDVNGTPIKVGDKVKVLVQWDWDRAGGRSGGARLYKDTIHTVREITNFSIKLESDPGNWEDTESRFEIIGQDLTTLAQVAFAAVFAPKAKPGEFYVAESRKNGSGEETFIRAGDLYRKKFETYDKAETFAIDRAQNNTHQKFAIMQIHSRIESQPLYETTVTRA
jgi:hypothetical protein